jgi:hypothetical protein
MVEKFAQKNDVPDRREKHDEKIGKTEEHHVRTHAGESKAARRTDEHDKQKGGRRH